MDRKSEIRSAIDEFFHIDALQSYQLSQIEYNIEFAPHKPSRDLKNDEMGIYIFFNSKRYVKIGIATDQGRFKRDNYRIIDKASTLAKSIKNCPHLVDFDVKETDIGKWMKENLGRAEIIMPKSWGLSFLKMFEAFLQFKFNPVYEGRVKK